MPAAPSCHVDVSGCNVWNRCCRCRPFTFFLWQPPWDHSWSHFCCVASSQHGSAVTSCCFLFSYFGSSHCLSLIPCWSIAFHCGTSVRACAGGVSTVLCWTAVLNHTGFLSCMNRYLIHSSLISGPPCSAHFAPCHPKCCWLLRFTCVSCTRASYRAQAWRQSSVDNARALMGVFVNVWHAASQQNLKSKEKNCTISAGFNFPHRSLWQDKGS